MFRSMNSVGYAELRSTIWIPLPMVFIARSRRGQSVLKPSSSSVVRCSPWFYLGLVAHSFFGWCERA